MEQKDLILDFNLYLCEKFGYRNSCSVMQNANGFCVDDNAGMIGSPRGTARDKRERGGTWRRKNALLGRSSLFH